MPPRRKKQLVRTDHPLDLRKAEIEQRESSRRKTAVYKHPDRAHIEFMLVDRSVRSVERWLINRYPLSDPANKRFHLSRAVLSNYRDKFLVDEDFVEPLDDPVMEKFVPPRPPRRSATAKQKWEIEEMELQLEAARAEYLKCKATDDEMGMTQDITLAAFDRWQQATARLIDYKAKLKGFDEYEWAPTKQQIEQHQQIEQVTVNVDGGKIKEPDEPEKFKLAKLLMATPPEERARLLALPNLIDHAEESEIIDHEDGGSDGTD